MVRFRAIGLGNFLRWICLGSGKSKKVKVTGF